MILDFSYLSFIFWIFIYQYINIPILNIGIYCQKVSHLVMPMPRPHHLTLQLLMARDTNLNKSHLSNSTDCLWTLELFLFFLIHIYTPILHTCVVKTTDTYDTKKLLLSVALLFVAKTNYQWCKRGFVNIS